jgi:hypothetical protein
MAPWFPPDGLFNDDYNDDFVKLDKPEKMKIPFKSNVNTKSQPVRVSILWLLILVALFLLTTLLGCSTSKRIPFKNHCNVQMVG